MGGIEWWQPVLALVGTVLLAYFAYRGAKATAASAKAGNDRTADVDAQESALKAWQELLAPYRDEVKQLRADLTEERNARSENQTNEEKLRRERETAVQVQMDRLTERIDLLTLELAHWKRLAKVIARWATTLRDQVLTLGGAVPATPDELLLIQTIDDYDQGAPAIARRDDKPGALG